GRPLISHEVVVQTIQSTTTKKGLKVHANLDKNKYETGKKVSDERMEALKQHIAQHEFHGEWNYSVTPSKLAK
ncbi:MAG: ISAzo13-like element transposase-related protein, partial [Candidatus Xenobia bacterium]